MVDRRYEGVRFAVDRVVHDGRQRDIVRHPGAAVILPIVGDDQICLIRNYRVSVEETLIELPAGTLEPNEPPEITAARELTEETGYTAESVELLVKFYPSPGIMDERMFVYVATGLTAGAPEREAGEEIENLVVSLDEAISMIGDGQIKDGKTIAGLLYYERFRRSSQA
ncbi:NUDIX hydrolase [Blastopirellula sp. JC732]|uniref:GDP-mannose pyrophosphatase n=1 Tax=Blastopirellula sediminis TaxID=2894196 RepID=A0A9X1MHU8_9BACT|nr:NUDIX hydrolase [Blastopirellula sediminis]MCC9604316.1 NUDIX hydrolase [Blastopirellula sediminis]MCC9626836.1 NUDIX hydrolase [Blastopirellula sediminis]